MILVLVLVLVPVVLVVCCCLFVCSCLFVVDGCCGCCCCCCSDCLLYVCVFFCVCVLFFVFNFFILRSVFLIPEVQTWSLIRVQLPLEQSDQWLQAGTNDYSLSDEEDQCDQSMRHFRRMVSKPTRATEEKQSRASVRVVGVAKGDTLCCVVGGWWLVVVCKL